jgi:hypothetical protein
MKFSSSVAASFLVAAMLMVSCGPKHTIDEKLEQAKFHILFRDHLTGEIVKGLTVQIVQYLGAPYPLTTTLGQVNAAEDGSITYAPPIPRHYLKVKAPGYVEALYSLDFDHKAGSQKHEPLLNGIQEVGQNVVFAELFKIEGNDGFFTTDLYPLAMIELKIKQTSPLPLGDHDFLYFNAQVRGTDPSDSRNYFVNEGFPNGGIDLDGSKLLDTSIRINAFGGYLNEVSWSLGADTVIVSGAGGEGWLTRKIVSQGKVQPKVLPRDTLARFTVTF